MPILFLHISQESHPAPSPLCAVSVALRGTRVGCHGPELWGCWPERQQGKSPRSRSTECFLSWPWAITISTTQSSFLQSPKVALQGLTTQPCILCHANRPLWDSRLKQHYSSSRKKHQERLIPRVFPYLLSPSTLRWATTAVLELH